RYIHGPASRPVIYYKGPCRTCGEVIVTERQPHRNKVEGNGRWPEYCAECWRAKDAAHNAAAKERMRRLREASTLLYDGWIFAKCTASFRLFGTSRPASRSAAGTRFIRTI